MQREPNIEKLARAAGSAPSPDNNQPWRFVRGADYLEIQLDASRSLPSDVNGMFDLTGIGAAVENACVAAREAGFEPNVELLPNGEGARIHPHFAKREDPHPGPLPGGEGVEDRLLQCSPHTPCAGMSAHGVSGLHRGGLRAIAPRQTSRGRDSRKLLPEEIFSR